MFISGYTQKYYYIGMSVYIASDDCDSDTVDKAEEVLKMLGEVVRVSKENYLDMATAVSGSGPAVS